jgi:hypothetical protein
MYYFGILGDTNGCTLSGTNSVVLGASCCNLLNANLTRIGTGAGLSGGALPNSLGSLTPVAGAIPIVVFET